MRCIVTLSDNVRKVPYGVGIHNARYVNEDLWRSEFPISISPSRFVRFGEVDQEGITTERTFLHVESGDEAQYSCFFYFRFCILRFNDITHAKHVFTQSKIHFRVSRKTLLSSESSAHHDMVR